MRKQPNSQPDEKDFLLAYHIKNLREKSFPGSGSDQWHRTLTGRQAPEPVGAKLRMIYGNIVAEQLPDHMLDLLSRLDSKRPKQ